MSYRRPLSAECAHALADLIGPLRARMADQGMSQSQVAIRVGRDRSRVSRALSGGEVPPRQLIADIARIIGADVAAASDRWARADATRRQALALAAGGGPPAGLASYPDLVAALESLMGARGVSHRELARRVPGLPRTTVGAVLRGERSARHDVVIAIVRACGVTADAERAWSAAWRQLGSPHRQQMRRRRYEGYRYAIDMDMPWI